MSYCAGCSDPNCSGYECGGDGSREVWHVIDSKRLIALLRRAHAGENPDVLYIEEYVNAEREEVAG